MVREGTDASCIATGKKLEPAYCNLKRGWGNADSELLTGLRLLLYTAGLRLNGAINYLIKTDRNVIKVVTEFGL